MSLASMEERWADPDIPVFSDYADSDCRSAGSFRRWAAARRRSRESAEKSPAAVTATAELFREK